MSTTLTNGLKLPDKGSVDWYADMQNNYNILDGAVGTIAEHTTQIAGKAPLVHTHTKADITDFPAYGNAAGTICEGNDSRLSDARTPVAHTHTKSDVTDLFNSANTWSEEQIFSSGMCLNGDRNAYIYPMWGGAASGIAFLVIDGSKQFVFGQRTTDANNRYRYDTTKGYLVIKTGETDGTNFVEVAPSGTDTKLGTSTNQWKSVYAQSYYYNGVAWGLDKNNKWLTTNIFYGSVPIFLRGSDDDIYNVSPQSLVQSLISFVDKNNTTMSTIVFQHRIDTPETHRLCIRQQKVASDGYYGVNLNNLGDFYPDLNNTINLGTSTNKWKTLNGINPGALSLPKAEYTNIDISAQGLNWDLTGGANTYTPTIDGWLEIWASRGSLANAYIDVDNIYIRNTTEVSVLSQAKLTIPVRNGQTYTVRILAEQCWVRIIKAEGNV